VQECSPKGESIANVANAAATAATDPNYDPANPPIMYPRVVAGIPQ
jgi:hypothetical protein